MNFIGEIFVRGGIFMFLILLAWLVGLIFALVALVKTRLKSNYSKRTAQPWIILSGILLILPLILGFIGRWKAISNLKKGLEIVIDISPEIVTVAKYEALLPLTFGILVFVILGILFVITIVRMSKPPP